MARSRSSSTGSRGDRKSTRLNSSHTVIYTLSYTTLFRSVGIAVAAHQRELPRPDLAAEPARHGAQPLQQHGIARRSEEHTSELQSHSDLHSFLHDALPICRHSRRGAPTRVAAP